MKTLRMQIVWNVLEAAKDNNDDLVISACRRLIRANTLGWRKYRNLADWQLVQEFAE
jgi:hypothetical protein